MKKFLACPSYIDNIVDVRYRKILYKKLLYLAIAARLGTIQLPRGWQRPRATTCARHASGRWPNSSSIAVPVLPLAGSARHKQLASSKNMMIIACAKGILALVRRRTRMR
jgi:hypothetical protein